MALDVMLGWRDLQAVGKIWRFVSNFSAKNLMINSHQAHQIAAHPFHHLPMGLPDDNIWGSLWLWMSCWVGGIYKLLARFGAILVQLFSQKPHDQQPSSTSNCCSSFSSSPNGSTR
jgi:hypothetical protein